jgi:hypothetical protein
LINLESERLLETNLKTKTGTGWFPSLSGKGVLLRFLPYQDPAWKSGIWIDPDPILTKEEYVRNTLTVEG